jgi:hypothetical protein
MPKTFNQVWTEEDDRRLLASKTAHKVVAVIAKELQRTEQSVISRTAILKRRGEAPASLG